MAIESRLVVSPTRTKPGEPAVRWGIAAATLIFGASGCATMLGLDEPATLYTADGGSGGSGGAGGGASSGSTGSTANVAASSSSGGTTCGSSPACGVTEFCDGTKCRAKKPYHAACDADEECFSGRCQDSKCAP